MFIGPVFNPLLKMLGADKIAIRASLCAAQLVGLERASPCATGVRSEPLHSMSVEMLRVDAINGRQCSATWSAISSVADSQMKVSP